MKQLLAKHTRGRQPDTLDRVRYQRIRGFFTGVLWHTLWWDIALNMPLLRQFRVPAPVRWQKIARRYRMLAVEMGGVLIKLGQFLSTRVDVLPMEVINELAGLQDEVPPEPTADIIRQIEADFKRPLDALFQHFSARPMGAASLAQAHRVKTVDGLTLIVKVLRPGIHRIVETDLAAIGLAVSWLRLYRPLRLRVDLDLLMNEFTAVTRKELDLKVEGHHIEQFAADFENDDQVYVPRVYWRYCARRTLAMEDVEYIKIGDTAAIDAAGIDRAVLAAALYRIYMKQVFETHFVHADPHPGNLFVKPLPHPDETEGDVPPYCPRDPVPCKPGRPFQIVFVDFGMMAVIPERMRTALREYVIGVGTRDAPKIVASYVKAGVLLKNADVRLIEAAHEALFDRFWGVRVGSLRDVAVDQARFFWREYREVILGQPFQFQAELLLMFRAVGILAGMATHLDPDFDPWSNAIPYAERYAREEFHHNLKDWRLEVETMAQILYKMPHKLDRVLGHAQRGSLTVQTALPPESRRTIQRLEQAVKRLGWMVWAAGLLISGVYLSAGGHSPGAGTTLLLLAAAAFLWGIRR